MKLVIKAKSGMEFEFVGTREELTWLLGEEGIQKVRDRVVSVAGE